MLTAESARLRQLIRGHHCEADHRCEYFGTVGCGFCRRARQEIYRLEREAESHQEHACPAS